jgi:hypothetical protein
MEMMDLNEAIEEASTPQARTSIASSIDTSIATLVRELRLAFHPGIRFRKYSSVLLFVSLCLCHFAVSFLEDNNTILFLNIPAEPVAGTTPPADLAAAQKLTLRLLYLTRLQTMLRDRSTA